MESFADLGGVGLPYIFLLFLRVSGLIFSSPIFGRQNIPSLVKISFSLALGYFFYTVYPQQAPLLITGAFHYLLLCLLELLFGVLMGYLLTLFFTASFTAGQMIDMQVGFGMVNVFDVQSNASVPLMGNLLNILFLILFFTTNSHQHLFGLMDKTFEYIPVGAVNFNAELGLMIAQVFSTMFLMAVRLALPVVGAGLISEIILGLIVRTVPQMNVFVIGMPLKALIGMAAMMLMIPVYTIFSEELFEAMFAAMDRAFMMLR